MSKQLPPRERGLKPEYFIEVWKNSQKEKFVSAPQRISIMEIYESTIAIFKIYPKNNSHE